MGDQGLKNDDAKESIAKDAIYANNPSLGILTREAYSFKEPTEWMGSMDLYTEVQDAVVKAYEADIPRVLVKTNSFTKEPLMGWMKDKK